LGGVIRYPTQDPVVPAGTVFPDLHYTVTAGAVTCEVHWNFKPDSNHDVENWATDTQRLILLIQTDVPSTLRYRSLFLNQCSSFRYFIESFKHGTVISTWQSVSDRKLPEDYAAGIIAGKTWAEIEEKLQDDEQDSPNKPRPRKSMEVISFP